MKKFSQLALPYIIWSIIILLLPVLLIAFYAITDRGNTVVNLVLAITLPTWINMLVRTYAWIGILSDGGILQSLLNLLGFKSTQLLYTEGAVLLGMVYNFIPFMILQINTSLSKMDKSLLEASSDLGANRYQTFWKVT